MKDTTRQSLLAIAATLAVGVAIAWAGSNGSLPVARADGPSLFAFCGGVSFAINWLVFVPSYLAQTEHYFDLTGSITYLATVGLACVLGAQGDGRSFLLAALISIWAIRLGSFLFVRIRQDGSDGRFDALKPDFWRFLMTWNLQGLWVFLTAACALAAITSSTKVPLGGFAVAGTAIWLAGFGIEVVADRQKRRFREDAANDGRFITSGLWSWSRHPNYFGEITLWLGIALISLPALSGTQVRHTDLTRVRLRAAHPHQRDSPARAARKEALGRRARLSGLRGANAIARASPAAIGLSSIAEEATLGFRRLGAVELPLERFQLLLALHAGAGEVGLQHAQRGRAQGPPGLGLEPLQVDAQPAPGPPGRRCAASPDTPFGRRATGRGASDSDRPREARPVGVPPRRSGTARSSRPRRRRAPRGSRRPPGPHDGAGRGRKRPEPHRGEPWQARGRRGRPPRGPAQSARRSRVHPDPGRWRRAGAVSQRSESRSWCGLLWECGISGDEWEQPAQGAFQVRSILAEGIVGHVVQPDV